MDVGILTALLHIEGVHASLNEVDDMFPRVDVTTVCHVSDVLK